MQPVRSTRLSSARPSRNSSAGGRPTSDRASLLSASRKPPAGVAAKPNIVGTVVLGVAIALLCVLSGAGYRAWTGQIKTEAQAEWQRSNQLRAALRVGDLKVPIDDKTCASFAFDNVTGVVGPEREVECYTAPAPARNQPLWNDGRGTVARVRALSESFKH